MITTNTSSHFKLGLLVALLFCGLQGFAQDPNFHIYLAFGQSNMEGQGTIENQDRSVDERFQVMQAVSCSGQPAGQWRTATPPIARCNTGLGPSDYFGREMIANLPENIKVGIVHVSVAGCKIELFDKDNYQSYLNGAEQYLKNIANEYGGNPYARLVELAQIAQQDGVIKGILLHQGESNTGDQQWPNKVKGVYEDLLADLNLNANDVPLLAGQVVDAEQGGICASMNSIINSLPNTIPTAHVVSSSGCTDQSDNLHFNSAGYRLLGRRYAETMLPLVDLGGLSVRFTAPANNANIGADEEITLEAEASTDDGQVTSVAFYEENELIATINQAPYSINWSSAIFGEHTLRVVAIDNQGNESESSITVIINVPQGPYDGVPHAIPGQIEFEEYDLGGNGSAYYDDSPGSEVTPVVNFRTDEDVDIENATDNGGGYNLGYTTAGEWLEYTVDVEASGTYTIELRVACNEAGRTIDLDMDGESIASALAIPNTGGWQAWETITVENVTLQAGEQVMRLTIGDEDYVNLNYVVFTAINVSEPPVVEFTAPTNISSFMPSEPFTLQASASDPDGEVVSVSFYEGDILLGTDETEPYSLEWSSDIVGTHTYTAIATDDKGISTSSTDLIIIIEAVNVPYNGAPAAIPGRIEIEEYDLGGEGLGFHEEDDNGNEGDATFRNDEVDIEETADASGDYNVGYTLEGEWLAYTVSVEHTGEYDVSFRYAVDGEGRAFHIEVDDVDVTGTLTVPTTGGYQIWDTYTVNGLALTEGEHVLKIVFEANYLNLNYMEFASIVTGTNKATSSTVRVYPNPFNGSGLTIVGVDNVKYLIQDLTGKNVESGYVSDGEKIGATLRSGVYLLKINTQTLMITKE